MFQVWEEQRLQVNKGKKSLYNGEEEHTKSSSDDGKEVSEIVYVTIKEDQCGEMYENETFSYFTCL